jgi:thioester reductase-like protein
VLLTGATGFLGRVLLHELLASGVETVRCLVLATDMEAGRGDIEGALRTAGLWNPDFADRIVPVPGNLSEPCLGLSQEEFSDLAERVDAVYHAGALVHMLYPYALLKPANVDGTAEALRLACLGRPKTFHHVSSLDVFPDGVPHSEEHVPADATGLTGAYAQSKWVAEAMVRAVSRRGLPVTIYRPANVAGDTRTGYWNTNDATYTLLRGCLTLGAAPDLDVTLALTPVDYAARAIVELSRQPSRGQAYHLYNPHPALPWRDAVAALAELGHPLELLPYEAWRSRGLEVEESAEQLGRMLALNAEFSGEAEAAAGQARSRTIVVSCAATVEALAGTPVRCPPVDAGFLAPFIDRWAQQGLIPASPDTTGDK